VQSQKVDFLDGVIGTANVAAVEPLVQKYCVPLIAADAGGTSVNQPSKYPFTTLWGSPFYVDVKGWFTYLKEKFPQGGKVAILTANTDSGQDYLSAINELSKGTNFKIVSKTTLDATVTAPPSSQVTTMKASGADILLAQTSPSGQCASLINEVAQQGWKPKAFMITNSCSTLQLIDPARKAAQGVLCNLWLNDPQAAGAKDDPGLQKIVSAIKQYAPNTSLNASNISGWAVMEVLYKAAEQAMNSPLGLSRLGILYAATHITYPTSTLQPGLTYSLNYPSDEVNIEAASLHSFDASTGQWNLQRLYDFNGQLTGKASG
jgi:branched-chain amino acid transport system substrate-binding protein